MRYKLFLILSFCALLILNFPKVNFSVGESNTKECMCMGFTYSASLSEMKCLGIPFSCSNKPNNEMADSLSSGTGSCMDISCDVARSYLGFDEKRFSHLIDKNSRKEGVNVILVIDASFSMKGKKISETKAAAIRFIQNLGPNDKVAIISFNKEAFLLTDFSSQREDAVSAVNNIEVKEDTRYIPALEMSLSMFTQLKHDDNHNFIIFLSDGEPSEDESEILNITGKVKESGIEIYTVWFGYTDSSTGKIFKKMSSVGSASPDEELKGFYSSSTTEALYLSFKDIYDTVRKEDFFFEIESSPLRYLYYEGEEIPIDLRLLSNSNKKAVPGTSVSDSNILCSKEARIRVDIVDEAGKVASVSLKYLPDSYFGLIDGLDTGRYSLYINVTVSYGDSQECSFQDYRFLKAIDVIAKPKTKKKGSPPCNILKKIVNDVSLSALNSSHDIPHELISKRLLLSIDSSESMKESRLMALRGALKDMLENIRKNHAVSLMAFSDEARLLEPFSSDKDHVMRKIDMINAGGTTRYLPALQKAIYLYSIKGNNLDNAGDIKDYMIFISDGLGWDNKAREDIISAAKKIVDKNVCIYTLGYGSGAKSSPDSFRVLEDMAELSHSRSGCGDHLLAYEGDIDDVLVKLYSRIRESEDDLYVDARVNNQILPVGEHLVILADVFIESNGLNLPSNLSINSAAYGAKPIEIYLPPAELNMTMYGDDGKSFNHDLTYIPGHGYKLVLSGIEKGIYNLVIDAYLSSSERSCTFSGTTGLKVMYYTPEKRDYSGYKWLFILLNLSLLSVFGLSLKKAIEETLNKRIKEI